MAVVPVARIVTVHIPYDLAMHVEHNLPEGKSIEDHIVDLCQLESQWAHAQGIKTLHDVRVKLSSASVPISQQSVRDSVRAVEVCDHEHSLRLQGPDSASDRTVRD